jgi:hypothetical protein
MADTALFILTGIVFEFGGTGDVQNGSTWLFRKIISAAAGNEQLVHHQPRNIVSRRAVFRTPPHTLTSPWKTKIPAPVAFWFRDVCANTEL